MIKCFIRFKDAWGEGLIESLQYPTFIPGILPIGTGINVPSHYEDYFLFDIDSYYYDCTVNPAEFIVYVKDDQFEGYDFDQEDIKGLLSKGWQYIKE